MNLDIALTKISSSSRSVRASYFDPEEVVSSRLAIVANRDLEVHWISSYRPGTAECDLIWPSLDKSKYLRRNEVNVLLLILVVQMATQRVVGV